MDLKELFANMSDDFKAKAKDIHSKEEFEALAKEQNIELTPEQVDALSGGDVWFKCSKDCDIYWW